MTKFGFVGVWLVACATPSAPESAQEEAGTLIRASVGGTVTAGDVTLVIPPGSLSEDTVISIDPEVDAPTAEADGFTVLGRGYKFSPPGTQFSLAKPAVLTMPYDQAAVTARSLDGRTVELAYFDEQLDRYFAIGGEIDAATGFVTARVEHFTLYVAMASTLLPGNNAPTIALQSPVPSLLRADSPVYLRATVRDYDVGGSIAGVELHYKTAATGGFVTLPMKPETTLDTFAALIPASHVVAAAGTADLEYFVTAVDNLGAPRTSTTTTADLTRTFAPGSLVMGPATPAIAAGFERTFTFQGRDETNALYAMVPETASATAIGETVIGTAGVTFKARTVGAGQVTAGFGAHGTFQNVTVFNGALERVAILDHHGLELADTVVLSDDKRMQLDAIGYDLYGNSILVNPVWSAEPAIGFVSSGGLLDTLDGHGSGRVTATVGSVVGAQWFTINQRQWQTDHIFGVANEFTAYQRLGTFANKPYAVFQRDGVLTVEHEEATGWVSDGSPTPGAVHAAAIAGGASRVYVAWIEGTHVRVAHRELGGWVQDGDPLEIDPNNLVAGFSNDFIDLTVDGDTPYVAWTELTADGVYNVYVKRWNGTSWSQLGGHVQASGAQAVYPSIKIFDGTPYVAFRSVEATSQIYVHRWTGSAWEIVGDSVNLYPQYGADGPKLTIAGDTLVVAYLQGIPFTTPPSNPVYITALINGVWTQIDPGGIFSPPSFAHVGGYSVAGNGDALFISYVEYGTGGARRSVARRNMRTGNWTFSIWGTGSFAIYDTAMTIVDGTPYSATVEYNDGVHYRVTVQRFE